MGVDNTSQDVEMENVEGNGNGEETEIKKDQDVVNIQEIREQARQIEKAVTNKEPR